MKLLMLYVEITALNSFAFYSWRRNTWRFTGFTDNSADRTSDDLFNHVYTVKKYQIKGKLLGQTFDGACLMNGHIHVNGL